ncbi:MAG: hypothetical protein HIU82_19475 [Proteobacteria bacterium]|nr:hypothetical protein [Pseudomonadota bacterium]
MDQHAHLTTPAAQAVLPGYHNPVDAPAGDDGTLLALVAEWHALDERLDRFWTKRRKARGEAAKAAVRAEAQKTDDRETVVMEAIAATPSQTPGGVLAKLVMVSTFSEEAIGGSPITDVLMSALRDARRLAGLPDEPAPRQCPRPH